MAKGVSTAVYLYKVFSKTGIDKLKYLKLVRCNISSLQLSLPLYYLRLSLLRDLVGLVETY